MFLRSMYRVSLFLLIFYGFPIYFSKHHIRLIHLSTLDHQHHPCCTYSWQCKPFSSKVNVVKPGVSFFDFSVLCVYSCHGCFLGMILEWFPFSYSSAVSVPCMCIHNSSEFGWICRRQFNKFFRLFH